MRLRHVKDTYRQLKAIPVHNAFSVFRAEIGFRMMTVLGDNLALRVLYDNDDDDDDA
jgi:hypothetical protein